MRIAGEFLYEIFKHVRRLSRLGRSEEKVGQQESRFAVLVGRLAIRGLIHVTQQRAQLGIELLTIGIEAAQVNGIINQVRRRFQCTANGGGGRVEVMEGKFAEAIKQLGIAVARVG